MQAHTFLQKYAAEIHHNHTFSGYVQTFLTQEKHNIFQCIL